MMSDEDREALVLFVGVLVIIGVSGFGLYGFFNNYGGVTHVWDLGEDRVVDDVLQFVSGTEYVPGQEGQVAVIVMNSSGGVVTDEYACNFTVLYPNKTVFVSGNFSDLTSLGTYYTTFVIPSSSGVYEYGSVCEKVGKRAVASKSFHVSTKRMRAVMSK